MAIFGFLQTSDPVLEIVRQSARRKADAELRLKFYHDRQTDELLEAIRRRWSTPDDFRLFAVNIVKKVIRQRAKVYSAAPARLFEGLDQTAGDDLYRDLAANVVLKKANRLTKLLKTTMLQVTWNDRTGRPALAVVTPNILDVVADDPENPTRVIVTHPGVRVEDTTYSDWTASTYRRLDWRGNVIPVTGNRRGVNPYGILPFVPVFDEHPDDAFFLPGGDDIIQAQEAVNVALVNLWRAIELQSHGQAWGVGIPAGDLLRAGPDRTITLPEGGSFGYAAPNTPIVDVLKAVEFIIKQTAVANDLAANVFELDAKAESAAAKQVENRDLMEARADDLDLWRTYEARLFDVLKAVVNTHAPGTIPEAASVRIEFGEIDEGVDEVSRLETYQRRVDLGVWSPVDVLMADNPDIRSREEAVEILIERGRERALLDYGLDDVSEATNDE